MYNTTEITQGARKPLIHTHIVMIWPARRYARSCEHHVQRDTIEGIGLAVPQGQS